MMSRDSSQRLSRVVESYVATHSPVKHQLDSYNQFTELYVPEIIHETPTVTVDNPNKHERHTLKIGTLSLAKPMHTEKKGLVHPLLPQEARLRDLTYDSPVLAEIQYSVHDLDKLNGGCKPKDALRKRFVAKNVVMCKLPVMVRSRLCYLSKMEEIASYHSSGNQECSFDSGGYFIVKGAEKTVLLQERVRANFPFVQRLTRDYKYAYKCEIRSAHERKIRSTSTIYVYMTRTRGSASPEIFIRLPFVKVDIPFYMLLALLGFTKPSCLHEILQYLLGYRLLASAAANARRKVDQRFVIFVESMLDHNVEQYRYHWPDKDSIYEWIGKQGTKEHTPEARRRYIDHILVNEFLPHVGQDNDRVTLRKKAYVLCADGIHKIVRVHLRHSAIDDRDHYANKRVDATGYLLAVLLRQLYKTMFKKISKLMFRASEGHKEVDVQALIDHKQITNGLRYALATGNWGTQKAGSTQTGVAQVLTRMIPLATLSHLRRLNTKVNRESKTPQPRQLHTSNWGINCCVETPEGKSCGLLKSLAMMCEVRLEFRHNNVLRVLAGEGLISMDSVLLYWRKKFRAPEPHGNQHPVLAGGIMVKYNGIPCGFLDTRKMKVVDFVNRLRVHRQAEILPRDCSIAYLPTKQEIRIWTDCGACVRPIVNLTRINRLLELAAHTPLEQLWERLCQEGLIEYVDKEEEDMYVVAPTMQNVIEVQNTLARRRVWKGLLQSIKSYCGAVELERIKPKTILSALNRFDGKYAAVRLISYTHVEVSPIVILGMTAATIPFPDHNQAPRDIYQCAHGKQAVGFPFTNLRTKFEAITHVLSYPQKPCTSTIVSRLLGFDECPTVQNATVAIGTYLGFDQEDAIVANQASIDRGLFRSIILHTHKEEENHTDGDRIVFEKPDLKSGHTYLNLQNANYSKLDDSDGLIPPATDVQAGDAIIGKVFVAQNTGGGALDGEPNAGRTAPDTKGDATCTISEVALQNPHITLSKNFLPSSAASGKNAAESKGAIRRDRSVILRPTEKTVIDEVLLTQGFRENSKTVKVRTRSLRIPEVGDKISSLHAQKGVLGILVPPEDLPFTVKDGIIPDLIINPHAIPSRMTVGQLLEMLSGKAACVSGQIQDGTPFSTEQVTLDQLSGALLKAGYSPLGKERMMCGMTGKMMEMSMFIGPCAYQRLRHMVSDKIHSRAKGGVTILVRQPAEGRSKKGGLRVGEMEKDTMLAHAAPKVLEERLMISSDECELYVCGTCGLIAIPPPPGDQVPLYMRILNQAPQPLCNKCKSHDNIRKVKMPYAAKLLLQELAAVHNDLLLFPNLGPVAK